MVARPFKAGMTRGHPWPFRRVATAEEMRPSGLATRRTVWGLRPNAGPEGPAYHQVVAARPKTSRPHRAFYRAVADSFLGWIRNDASSRLPLPRPAPVGRRGLDVGYLGRLDFDEPAG